MKMKIKGVSIWIWTLGIAVSLGIVATVLKTTESSERGVTNETSEHGSKQIKEAFSAIKRRLNAQDSVKILEDGLKKESSAGAAALGVEDLKESKGILQKAVDDESKALSQVSGEAATKLRKFSAYGTKVICEFAEAEAVKGILHPDYLPLHKESNRVLYDITLSEVMAGGYEAEVMK